MSVQLTVFWCRNRCICFLCLLPGRSSPQENNPGVTEKAPEKLHNSREDSKAERMDELEQLEA